LALSKSKGECRHGALRTHDICRSDAGVTQLSYVNAGTPVRAAPLARYAADVTGR